MLYANGYDYERAWSDSAILHKAKSQARRLDTEQTKAADRADMRYAFNRIELKTRLIQEFGEAGDYSPYPRADWKDQVVDGTTHAGYWDWVVVQEQQHIIETRNSRILRLAREGIHPNVIAESVGVAKATVFRVRRDAGDTALMQYRRGSEAEKLQAKLLLEDGASYWEVGRTLGFSGSSVSRWFPGYTWSAIQRSESSAMSRKLNQLDRLTLAEKV